MKKKQFRTRLIVLILLVMLLIGLIGFAQAKYTTTVSYRGQITFSASLAQNVVIREHKAVRLADGSYVLHDGNGGYPDEVVSGNSYKLIPGLDIPKDPHIIIQNKTPIDAYLFVEIVNTLDTPVTYELTGDWQAVSVTGKNGGAVYCYKDVVFAGFSEDPVYILSGNKVTVSQHLRAGSVEDGDDVLQLYVSLIEKGGTQTAAQAYGG